MKKERNFENVIAIIKNRAESYGRVAINEWAENGGTPLWREARSIEQDMNFILDLFNNDETFQQFAEIWLPDE